jgi:phosphoribosylglycinamide formyltransferase 2
MAQAKSQQIAKAVTDNLGGLGLFGVELFVKGEQVWFSEVSPRPHDTGWSRWHPVAERVRAACPRHPGPAGGHQPAQPGASAVIYGGQDAQGLVFDGVDEALACPAPICACSASPRALSSAAWAWPWRALPMWSRPA